MRPTSVEDSADSTSVQQHPIVLKEPSRWVSFALRYGLAIGTTAVTVAVAVLFRRYDISINLTILIVAAILIPTWYGGVGPGLLVAVSFVLVTAFSRPPAPDASIAAFVFGYLSNLLLLVLLILLVSSRRKTENKLNEQREWLEQTLSSIHDGVIATDSDGVVNFINPLAEKLTGRSASEAIGTNVNEVFTVIDSTSGKPAEDLVSKVLRLGTDSGLFDLNILVNKAGKELYVASQAAPIKASDGNNRGVVLIIHDTSEQIKAEESILAAEQRYRDLVENAIDIIYTHDLAGKYLSVNKAAERITGYTIDEALKMNMADIVAPEFLDTAKQMIAEKLAGEDITAYELGLITKDGRSVTVEVNSRMIHENGDPVGIQGIARDVTDRKKAEAALRESEVRFEMMVESVKDYAIIMLDSGGSIESWNSGAERITGYTSDEVVGQHFSIFYPQEGIQNGLPERELAVAAAEGRYEEEGFRIRKDGSKFVADVIVTAIYDEDGVVQGFVKVTRDISDRRQFEDQNRQAQKMEAVGALAGGVAHDFNNLLTAINGFSDLTLQRMSADEPLRRHVEEIRNAGERAKELTDQLLAFSRKQVLKPAVHNVNTVVSNLENMLRRIIKENIELRTVLNPELGNIKADPGQIEQVILNLAINARDAMPQGGVLTIDTRNIELDENYVSQHLSVSPGPFIRLTVTDTGVGMDKETQERIFEPFFTTKEVGKGTGLGLPTVYGIVKQSGGDLMVYSEPGHGTSMKIYLPRIDEEIEKQKWTDDLFVPQPGTETVVVVEDEEAVRTLVSEILSSNGYKVLEASSGIEALSICKDHDGPIHLLLTDVVMPKMGGTELRKKMNKLFPDLKVIFMSGYTDESISPNFLREGNALFIEKPFSPDSLIRKIREALAS